MLKERQRKPGVVGSSTELLENASGRIAGTELFARLAIKTIVPDAERRNEIASAYADSVKAARRVGVEAYDAPLAGKTPESQRLITLLAGALTNPESEFIYPKSLGRLYDVLESGSNVVLAANHYSTADGIALMSLLKRADAGRYDQIFDRVVVVMRVQKRTAFDLQAMAFFNGFNRVQVYSPRDFGRYPKEEHQAMTFHNIAALRELNREVKAGGKMFIVFPQGGTVRTGVLEEAPKEAGQIFELATRSVRDAFLMPVYIQGTLDMFRTKGAPLSHRLKPCKIRVSVGELSDLKQLVAEANATAEKTSADQRGCVVKAVMTEIARLAPPEEQGAYRIT